MEWFSMWYSAAVRAIADAAGWPEARKMRNAPMAAMMMPAFSIELCASIVFISLSVVA